MRKKVAIWIHGGVGSGLASQGQPVIMRLIQWMSTQYDVDVYSVLPPNEKFLPVGFCVHTPERKIRRGSRRWITLVLMFFKINAKKKYDCMYAFWGYPSGVVAYFIGRLIGRPAVLHLQGGDSVGLTEPSYGIFRHTFRGWLCRYVYNRCSAMIALTEIQKSLLLVNGVKRRVDVIPYGVDGKIFSFKAKSLFEKKFGFLHVGNLTPVKGQKMMLKTFAAVCEHLDAELTIVGPDYDDGSLLTLVKSLNVVDRVRFAGHQLYHDLPSFYHSAHVLIHTSVYEGQAVVFAEAASCGTLIAGTKVGMLADMDETCGIRVDNHDHKQLANRIIDVLRSPDEFQKYIRAAKAWIHERDEHFTFRSVKKIIEKTDKRK